MRMNRGLFVTCCLLISVALSAGQIMAQSSSGATLVITPATDDIAVGQKVKFTLASKNANGKVVEVKPATWVAAPFDLAAVDEAGTVSFFAPGEV